MKKLQVRNIIIIIYALIAIGGAITFFIVYKNLDSKIAIKFVVAYVLFLFLSVSYMLGMSLYNLRKLKWLDVKKRLIKFIIAGIAISILNCFFDYIFMPDKIDIASNSVEAFVLSFAITFFDLLFVKTKNNKSNIK